MFRIIWTYRISGYKSQGEAVFTEEEAYENVKYYNRKFPEISHDIEKYEPPVLSLNVKGHRCSYGDLTFVAHATPPASAETTPLATETPVPSASSPSAASLSVKSPQLR